MILKFLKKWDLQNSSKKILKNLKNPEMILKLLKNPIESSQ